MKQKYKLAAKIEQILAHEETDVCIDALRIATTQLYAALMAVEEEIDYNLADMTTQGTA